MQRVSCSAFNCESPIFAVCDSGSTGRVYTITAPWNGTVLGFPAHSEPISNSKLCRHAHGSDGISVWSRRLPRLWRNFPRHSIPRVLEETSPWVLLSPPFPHLLPSVLARSPCKWAGLDSFILTPFLFLSFQARFKWTQIRSLRYWTDPLWDQWNKFSAFLVWTIFTVDSGSSGMSPWLSERCCCSLVTFDSSDTPNHSQKGLMREKMAAPSWKVPHYLNWRHSERGTLIQIAERQNRLWKWGELYDSLWSFTEKFETDEFSCPYLEQSVHRNDHLGGLFSLGTSVWFLVSISDRPIPKGCQM